MRKESITARQQCPASQPEAVCGSFGNIGNRPKASIGARDEQIRDWLSIDVNGVAFLIRLEGVTTAANKSTLHIDRFPHKRAHRLIKKHASEFVASLSIGARIVSSIEITQYPSISPILRRGYFSISS